MSEHVSPPASPDDAESPLSFQRVLVPLDFSEHARKALRHGRGLARQFGAKLILLHVVEPMVYPSDLGYTPVLSEELTAEVHQEAENRLQAAVRAEQARGIECEGLLRFGRPYLEIAALAEEQAVDLIVLTTHGYTGLKHVVLGSTAERVVRHAPCPVLVVRDRRRSAPAPDAPPDKPAA
jgi:nucleotide-binding universal stress UspA family protein